MKRLKLLVFFLLGLACLYLLLTTKLLLVMFLSMVGGVAFFSVFIHLVLPNATDYGKSEG